MLAYKPDNYIAHPQKHCQLYIHSMGHSVRQIVIASVTCMILLLQSLAISSAFPVTARRQTESGGAGSRSCLPNEPITACLLRRIDSAVTTFRMDATLKTVGEALQLHECRIFTACFYAH